MTSHIKIAKTSYDELKEIIEDLRKASSGRTNLHRPIKSGLERLTLLWKTIELEPQPRLGEERSFGQGRGR